MELKVNGLELTSFSCKQIRQSFLHKENQVFDIELNNETYQKLGYYIPHPEEVSNTVSIIGTTHSGKSAVLRCLSGGSLFDSKAEIEQNKYPYSSHPDDESIAPTSSNVKYYHLNGVNYLDIEGNSPGNVLPVEERNFEYFNSLSEAEKRRYFNIRRNSIKEHLPRLAYVVSDVIILVSTDNFASNQYYSNEEVAKASLAGVENAEKPALILLQNKVGRVRKTSEELTNEFFAVHDNTRTLLDYYSDVRCFQLISNDDENDVARNQLFNQQIDQLKQLINDLSTKILQIRKECGTDFNNRVWIHLLSRLFEIFNTKRGLRMGNIMSEVIAKYIGGEVAPSAVSRALMFFNLVFLSGGSRKWYIKARRETLIYFTCIYIEAISIAESNAQFSTSLWRNTVDEEYRKKLKGLIKELNSLAPCQARNQQYYCSQIRKFHSQPHHQRVEIAGSRSIWKRICLFIGPSFTGPFEFNDECTEMDLFNELNSFYHTLNFCLEDCLAAKIEAIRNVLHLEELGLNPVFQLDITNCFFCLNEIPSSLSIKCGHKFCTQCKSSIVNFEGAESVITRKFVRSGCPLC